MDSQKVMRVGPGLLKYVERLVEMGDAQNRASGHGPMFRRNMGPGNLSKGSSRLAGPWSRHRLGQTKIWGLKRCKKTSSTNACKDLAADAKTLTLASISLRRNTGLTLMFGTACRLPRADNWAAVLTPSRLIKQTNVQPHA